MRSMLKEFAESGWGNFVADYKTLKPYDRVKVFIEIMPYVTPRLSSIDSRQQFDLSTLEDHEVGVLLAKITSNAE